MMPEARFEWDDRNSEDSARHGVDPDDAEAVLNNHPLILRSADSKYLVCGQTDDGRLLLVVFLRRPGAVRRVVTARDLTDTEKKNLRERRK